MPTSSQRRLKRHPRPEPPNARSRPAAAPTPTRIASVRLMFTLPVD